MEVTCNALGEAIKNRHRHPHRLADDKGQLPSDIKIDGRGNATRFDYRRTRGPFAIAFLPCTERYVILKGLKSVGKLDTAGPVLWSVVVTRVVMPDTTAEMWVMHATIYPSSETIARFRVSDRAHVGNLLGGVAPFRPTVITQ